MMTSRSHPLLTYSQPWPEASLLGLLKTGAGHPRVYWESEKSCLAIAGYGVAARLTADGEDRFSDIANQVKNLFTNITPLHPMPSPNAYPALAGGFAFRPGQGRRDPFWAAFPDACFILPRVQLTRHAGETWLTLNHLLSPDEDLETTAASLIEQTHDLLWQGLPDDFPSPTQDASTTLPGEFIPFTPPEHWSEMVTTTTDRIRAGDLQKAVLARTAHLEAERPLSLPDILARLAARYPDCYRFLIEPEPGHAFFGATPELLAEVTGRQLHTVALAGSIQRGRTWDEDQTLGQQLLASTKDRHEHDLVVRSIERNLQPLVADLKFPAIPELCLLNNIQHLLTPVSGHLANGKGIIPVIQALHPTPALGGTPRGLALPLIEQLESLPRGWYGAPVGWLAPHGDGAFAVAIRSAVMNQNRTRLYAGAGIVEDSDPEKEWRETELKFRPILQALDA